MNPDDFLTEQLQSAAKAERPTVPPALRTNILRQIDKESGTWRRWPFRAAAAILIASAVAISYREMRQRRQLTPSPIAINPITPPAGQTPQPEPAIAFDQTLQIGPNIVAKLYPPQIEIRVPILVINMPQPLRTGATTSPHSSSLSEASIAQLEQPAVAAQQTVADLLPPDIRRLGKLAFEATR